MCNLFQNQRSLEEVERSVFLDGAGASRVLGLSQQQCAPVGLSKGNDVCVGNAEKFRFDFFELKKMASIKITFHLQY